MTKMRTHILISEPLVEAIDRLVGRRGRSTFFAEAAERELARRILAETASEAAGALAEHDIPGWDTPEMAADWVRALRREDEKRLERLLEA